MSAETKPGPHGLTLHPLASTVYEGARCGQHSGGGFSDRPHVVCAAQAVWMGVPPQGGPYVYLLCEEHAQVRLERGGP